MFTGIITDVGEIIDANSGSFVLRCSYDPQSISVGASIACAGCCLTVTAVSAVDDGAEFSVDVSNETRSRTTLGAWCRGAKINLERSLRAGEELGGHVVTGHIDGIVRVADIHVDGECQRFVFEAPDHLAQYIAPKGSVALDGTSLTVNEVAASRFGVNLIPHSLSVTTWGDRQTGDDVNIEVDLFARYIARILEYRT